MSLTLGTAALLAGGSVLGSTIGGLFGSSSQNSQNSFNALEAEKQRTWEAEQAEIARLYNAEQAQLDRNWNSIAERAKRAASAGLNPLSVAENAGAISSAAAASPMPAGAAATAAPASLGDGVLNLQSLAGVINTLSQAAKTSKETGRYDEQIDALLDKYKSEVALNVAQKDIQETQGAILKAFGRTKEAVSILKDYNEALSAAAAGEASKADAELKKVQKALTYTQNESAKLELAALPKKIQSTLELLQEQSETERSKQEANKAAASESRAGAEQKHEVAESERQFRSARKVLLENQGKNAESQNAIMQKQIRILKNTLTESEIRAEIAKVEKRDKESYSALLRLFFGKPSASDFKTGFKFFTSPDTDWSVGD